MSDVLVLRIFDHAGPGRLVRLSAFPAVIGRSVFVEVPIEVDTLDLRHATIERREEGGFLLTDLKSANGTAVAGQKIVSQRVDANLSAELAGVRVDFILTEPATSTRIGMAQSHPAELDARALRSSAGVAAACYLALCAVYAFRQFAGSWPPERPSELFTDALAAFAVAFAAAFFGALARRAHARSFSRLLATATGVAAWFLLLDELRDLLVYNLWLTPLRAAVPPAVVLASAALGLAAFLRPLFPAWRRARLLFAAAMAAGVACAFLALRDHYRFQESDQRADPIPFGLPLGDPARGARDTGALLEAMRASAAKVDAARQSAAADDGG